MTNKTINRYIWLAHARGVPESFIPTQVGIYVNPALEPKKIIIRIFDSQVDYVRSVPIHLPSSPWAHISEARKQTALGTYN